MLSSGLSQLSSMPIFGQHNSNMLGYVPLATSYLLGNSLNFISLCCLESSLTNLEEAVNKNQLQEDDDDPPQCEDSSELETDHSKSSATNEVEMERVLLLLFGNICRWQEHSVLGTLMSRLANRMACRLVLHLIFCLCERGVVLCCHWVLQLEISPHYISCLN